MTSENKKRKKKGKKKDTFRGDKEKKDMDGTNTKLGFPGDPG